MRSVSVVLGEALSATTAGDTVDRVTAIMDDGFQKTLDHIRSIADSEAHKGRLFERLMKTYFTKDPIYRERFVAVWLWSEWSAQRPDFDGTDTGIDLVAAERDGRGYCAIQCKCYAPGTRISKPHLDSFIAASAREPFTARIVVDTGDEWGTTARKAIAHLKPACFVLRFGDLASRPFDWPDLGREEPEDLSYRHEPFSLRPHQQAAFDDVIEGFQTDDRVNGQHQHHHQPEHYDCGQRQRFPQPPRGPRRAGVRHGESIAGKAWTARTPAAGASLHELEIPVYHGRHRTSRKMALCMARAEAIDAPCLLHLPVARHHRAGAEGRSTGSLTWSSVTEAHRTTGIEQAEAETSQLCTRPRTAAGCRAEKRLYMTATPRLYTEGAKAKAARH